jgi:hypothetical protein
MAQKIHDSAESDTKKSATSTFRDIKTEISLKDYQILESAVQKA